jgi:hypothetical protein
MNNPEHPEQRMLVIANRTCPCDALADEVASRARVVSSHGVEEAAFAA